MKRTSLIPVVGSLACLFLGTILAEEPQAPATLLAQPGKLLFADAFTKDATPLTWKVGDGKWERTNEGLRGEELPEDKHPAHTITNQPLGDFVASYEFRFDGANTASFTMFVKGCHIASVRIAPNSFKVIKTSNAKGLGGDSELFLLKPIKLKKDAWHRVVFEMVGNTLVATLDGEISAFGTNEIFKEPTKSASFGVAGQTATFRNFAVWEAKAEPKHDWTATSLKIGKAMKDTTTAGSGAVK